MVPAILAEVLVGLDWLVVLAVVAGTLGVALLFARKAGGSLEDYFVSGRSLPWWLAGTSIVATTFACDTPLAITEGIRDGGIYRSWLWWCLAGGHVLGVVMLARLWRRSRLVTDVSLIEIRYDGPSATVLQVFRAVYFGIVWNLFVIGWVVRAMLAILSASVGRPLTGDAAALELGGVALSGPQVHALAVAGLMLLATAYSLFSGLWGVVVSDLVQFGIAMVGAVLLAVYSVNAAGGLDALLVHEAVQGHTDIVPPLGGGFTQPLALFLVYVGLMSYTDKTVDSGGYIAQRLLAAKDERHGTLAMLWFVVAHYALRPWPWVMVALASLVLLPAGTVAHIDAYPQVIMQVLPAGLRGLVVASLLAAFTSTVNSQLNWGASYLTRDVYVRLWRPEAAPRELVWVGRAVTLALMASAAVVSYHMDGVEKAWKFLALLGAGSGLVLLGRWLWWRINAASEIAVLSAAFVGGIALRVVLPAVNARTGWTWSPYGTERAVFPLGFEFELPLVVAVSTMAWIVATWLTRPTSPTRLRDFYLRTRPPGPGWSAVAAECGLRQPRGVLRAIALAWGLGVTFVFGWLLGLGGLLLGQPVWGLVALIGGTGAGAAFLWANARAAVALETPPTPLEPPVPRRPIVSRTNP